MTKYEPKRTAKYKKVNNLSYTYNYNINYTYKYI